MTAPAFTPLFVPGGMGPMELAVIFMIAVLLFGANKIPKLARSTGQAMGEFRRGREEIEEELQGMASEAEEAATAETTGDDTTVADTAAEAPEDAEDTDEDK